MVYSFFKSARNWTSIGVIHYFWFFFRRLAASSNQALEPGAGDGLGKAVPLFERQYLTGSFYPYHSFSVIVAQPLSFTLHHDVMNNSKIAMN